MMKVMILMIGILGEPTLFRTKMHDCKQTLVTQVTVFETFTSRGTIFYP
jgi:hypothetical protein